jgi:MFS transporter, PHS family, inorganic phosphate transporter
MAVAQPPIPAKSQAEGAIGEASTNRAAVDARMLDEAPIGAFQRRVVLTSGVGFFTDAYDLFVISTVALLVTAQWHLDVTETSWVTGSAILGAFVGAFVFGRLADVHGRKRIYLAVAIVMVVGALASACAPGVLWLVAARFVLGVGIGGDYPVSAVLMSEFSNRKDRGRLVGLVFSMQAVGLVVGPLVALALFGAGVDRTVLWRLLLGFGAVPAAAVIYLRSTIPESPRFESAASSREAARARPALGSAGLSPSWRFRGMVRLLIGTAGAWFCFDYAYYGNTLSLPAILKEVDARAAITTKLGLTLAMFVVFAVPGYLLAVLGMDRVGHRRLQLVGFAVMIGAFLVLAVFPPLTTAVVPFVAIFGVSYFFVEFGPNTTTFVLPSEVFPTAFRTTGHGIAAGIGKLGAFVGVFVVPQLQAHIGLRGMLAVAAGASAFGLLVTLPLPEPAGRRLDEVARDA